MSAVTPSAHTQLDPSPIETDPDAGQVRTEPGQINAPESVDNHHTLYHVGDVVRVPLMPRGDSVITDPGLPLDPVHEPTVAVKLLEVHQDKDLGAVWSGIRVQDELAVEGFQPIQPKEVHKGRYLQLSHALAPEVRLHSTKRSKHYPLPKPGSKARTSIEQQVAQDATLRTELIRKHIKEKSIVYLIHASSNRDDTHTFHLLHTHHLATKLYLETTRSARQHASITDYVGGTSERRDHHWRLYMYVATARCSSASTVR